MIRLCAETNCVWLWKTWLLLDCFLVIRPCHKIILLTRHLCSQIVIYKFVNTIWKLSATDSFNKEDKIVQDFYMWNLFVSLENLFVTKIRSFTLFVVFIMFNFIEFWDVVQLNERERFMLPTRKRVWSIWETNYIIILYLKLLQPT